MKPFWDRNAFQENSLKQTETESMTRYTCLLNVSISGENSADILSCFFPENRITPFNFYEV